jgi:hypothetical protein
MGSRAWGAVERTIEDMGENVHYARTDRDSPALPQIVYELAQELGWESIWQLTYCQWCAGYAHDSEPGQDYGWGDVELNDARQVWGPTPRSIFSIVDRDEAAWMIPANKPTLGLWETKPIGYLSSSYGTPEGFVPLKIPYIFQLGPENTGKPISENEVIMEFWANPLAIPLVRLNEIVIQIPFETRGSFATFRDYDRDADGDTNDGDPLNQLLYLGPLPRWWHKVLIEDNYQWPPDTINSYLRAFQEQIGLILDELQSRWTNCGMQGRLEVSTSSPLQPYKMRDSYYIPPKGSLNKSFMINLADGLWNKPKFFLDFMSNLQEGVGLIEIHDGVAVVVGG